MIKYGASIPGDGPRQKKNPRSKLRAYCISFNYSPLAKNLVPAPTGSTAWGDQ